MNDQECLRPRDYTHRRRGIVTSGISKLSAFGEASSLCMRGAQTLRNCKHANMQKPGLARRNVLHERFNAPPPTHFRKWFPWCTNYTYPGTWTVMNGDSLCSTWCSHENGSWLMASRRSVAAMHEPLRDRTLRHRYRGVSCY